MIFKFFGISKVKAGVCLCLFILFLNFIFATIQQLSAQVVVVICILMVSRISYCYCRCLYNWFKSPLIHMKLGLRPTPRARANIITGTIFCEARITPEELLEGPNHIIVEGTNFADAKSLAIDLQKALFSQELTKAYWFTKIWWRLMDYNCGIDLDIGATTEDQFYQIKFACSKKQVVLFAHDFDGSGKFGRFLRSCLKPSKNILQFYI